MSDILQRLSHQLERSPDKEVYGKVSGILGMLVEISGLDNHLSVGDRCMLSARGGRRIPVEIVGFKNDKALAMPFSQLDGVGLGSRVDAMNAEPVIYPSEEWLGRVINAFGEPIDGKGPLPQGSRAYLIHNQAIPAHRRDRVGGKLDLGVRSLNTFTTCCRGQRMGIFSASGVGKSTMLSMIAKFTESDISVIGLIGERGREVQEFLQDDLGEEGLARSVIIVATSDESALMRRQAAYMTMAVAEYFRDLNRDVLCLMDSVTRFAMAQREIGLSVGEPPASKGYTPTVFAELPKLLERSGPGLKGGGSITGLFTVLVEGDDMNEPVSDAVRGILDGHIILDRSIAERGRYPAVNVLRSISRMLPDCNTNDQNGLLTQARLLLSTYADMSEMIRLGAYRKGSDPTVDKAIFYYPMLEDFLSQNQNEPSHFDQAYAELAAILNTPMAK